MGTEKLQAKLRDSNFELLRIFAMFGIVISHLEAHALYYGPDAPITAAWVLSKLLYGVVSSIGNWSFILLSGYFISAKTFSYKRFFTLWLQIFMTSAIIAVITYKNNLPIVWIRTGDAAMPFVTETMTLGDFVKWLLPCYFSTHWFATTYLIFFLMVPLLDKVVSSLPREDHWHAIVLLTVLGTVVALLPIQRFFKPTEIYLFILGFFIAKYIRLYEPPFFSSVRRNSVIALGILVFILGYKICCHLLLPHTPVPEKYFRMLSSIFDGNFSFPILICSLCIFSIFRHISIPYNRVINTIASTTFGIYLIHETAWSKWWWLGVCRVNDFADSPYLVGYVFVCAIGTFMLCAVLELFRKYAVEKPLLALIFRQKKQPATSVTV